MRLFGRRKEPKDLVLTAKPKRVNNTFNLESVYDVYVNDQRIRGRIWVEEVGTDAYFHPHFPNGYWGRAHWEMKDAVEELIENSIKIEVVYP